MFMAMHNSNEKLLLGIRNKWIRFRDFVFKFPIIIFLGFQGWGHFYFCSCCIWVWAQWCWSDPGGLSVFHSRDMDWLLHLQLRLLRMLCAVFLQGHEASFSKYPWRILNTLRRVEITQSEETNLRNLRVPTPSNKSFPESSAIPLVTLNYTHTHTTKTKQNKYNNKTITKTKNILH